MRDRTKAITSAIGSQLSEGEAVLGAVSVALPGVGAARIVSAGRVADGHFPAQAGVDHIAREGAAAFGIDGLQFHLVVTDARLLLVRRSVFGRAKQVVLVLPLGEVAAFRLPRASQTYVLEHIDGRSLKLELPKAPKFLPEVYTALPARFRDARAALRAD